MDFRPIDQIRTSRKAFEKRVELSGEPLLLRGTEVSVNVFLHGRGEFVLWHDPQHHDSQTLRLVIQKHDTFRIRADSAQIKPRRVNLHAKKAADCRPVQSQFTIPQNDVIGKINAGCYGSLGRGRERESKRCQCSKEQIIGTHASTIAEILSQSERRGGRDCCAKCMADSSHKTGMDTLPDFAGSKNGVHEAPDPSDNGGGPRPSMKPKKPPSKPSFRLLGKSAAAYPASPLSATLETFPNRHSKRDYWIQFDCPEFTSMCPVTGQPDFATIRIRYVPAELCIETKSLKFYLASYRHTRSFNEEIVNRILEDLVAACNPRRVSVHGEFASRGGIRVTVDASHPEDI